MDNTITLSEFIKDIINYMHSVKPQYLIIMSITFFIIAIFCELYNSNLKYESLIIKSFTLLCIIIVAFSMLITLNII